MQKKEAWSRDHASDLSQKNSGRSAGGEFFRAQQLGRRRTRRESVYVDMIPMRALLCGREIQVVLVIALDRVGRRIRIFPVGEYLHGGRSAIGENLVDGDFHRGVPDRVVVVAVIAVAMIVAIVVVLASAAAAMVFIMIIVVAVTMMIAIVVGVSTPELELDGQGGAAVLDFAQRDGRQPPQARHRFLHGENHPADRRNTAADGRRRQRIGAGRSDAERAGPGRGGRAQP